MKPSSKPLLQQIPVELIERSQFQPRRHFDNEALLELAQSIQNSGVLQPVLVRPLLNNRYEIIAGERRWRAAQMAGLHNIPCLVNQYSDEQAAEIAIIENVNRVDLNPIEEALGYQRLIDDFRYIHDEVGAVVGKSRAKITNSLRLLKLGRELQQWIVEEKLSEGHAKVLAGVDSSLQLMLATKCIAKAWSVRKLEEEIKLLESNHHRPAKKADANLKALEKQLTDHFGCKVAVDFSEHDVRGEIRINYQNLDILQGLLQKMGLDYKD